MLFLNGYLDKPVYMEQPPGFVDPARPQKLKKALYGLRQAPLAWYQRFCQFLVHIGFSCSSSDTTQFFFRRGTVMLYLLVYVDDIVKVYCSKHNDNHNDRHCSNQCV